MGVVSVALWAAFASPLLDLREVEVQGVTGMTSEQVREAARVPAGVPLARIDTSDVAARVGRLPRVASAHVARAWPHTLRITVTERAPVARQDDSTVVDAGGATFGTAPTDKLAALPELRTAADSAEARASGVAVLTALPDEQRSAVRTVFVQPDMRVVLRLHDGRTVVWGAAERASRKAQVLEALLEGPAGKGMRRFDVSSPEAPSVSRS